METIQADLKTIRIDSCPRSTSLLQERTKRKDLGCLETSPLTSLTICPNSLREQVLNDEVGERDPDLMLGAPRFGSLHFLSTTEACVCVCLVCGLFLCCCCNLRGCSVGQQRRAEQPSASSWKSRRRLKFGGADN